MQAVNNMPILRINNGTKMYKKTRGAQDISFDIYPGEVVGLLGPNGSGKTTTMKMITGLVAPDSGEIFIHNYNVEENVVKALSSIGCLIEQPALHLDFTVKTNMKMAARYYKDVTEVDINYALEICGLTPYIKDKAKALSLGLKQRLGIALCMMSKPSIYILDEPVNGLDIDGMVQVRQIINQLSQETGAAFLISSHLATELEQVCSRVIVMRESKIISQINMQELLLKYPSLESYYLDMTSQLENVKPTLAQGIQPQQAQPLSQNVQAQGGQAQGGQVQGGQVQPVAQGQSQQPIQQAQPLPPQSTKQNPQDPPIDGGNV